MTEPVLLKAHLATDGAIVLIDVLQIGNELWLVPRWLVAPSERLRTPARAIRADVLPHQRSGMGRASVTMNNAIPKAVLYGPDHSAEGTQYEVVEGPSDHFGWLADPVVH